MTREVKTEHKLLHHGASNDRHRYATHLGMRDVVQLHRLYVPGVADEDVLVLGLWRDSGNENLLLRPVQLTYLNLLQGWFSWGTMWGIEIELERPAALTMEVTLKVDRPFLESMIDQAYIAWRKKYPHGSVDSWGAYAANHVKEGKVECEMNRCEEPVVAGSTCCVEHQKFARSE